MRLHDSCTNVTMSAAFTPPAGPSLCFTPTTRLARSGLLFPVSAMCSHEAPLQFALMLVAGHAGMLGCGCTYEVPVHAVHLGVQLLHEAVIFLGGAAGAIPRLAPILRALPRPEHKHPSQEAVHPDRSLPASCRILGVLSQDVLSETLPCYSVVNAMSVFDTSLSPCVGLGGRCRHLYWCLQVQMTHWTFSDFTSWQRPATHCSAFRSFLSAL